MSANALSTSEFLKFANLQMAAEAFLKNEQTGAARYTAATDPVIAFSEGSDQTSVFTSVQATAFADHWVALDHAGYARGWDNSSRCAETESESESEIVIPRIDADTPRLERVPCFDSVNRWRIALRPPTAANKHRLRISA